MNDDAIRQRIRRAVLQAPVPICLRLHPETAQAAGRDFLEHLGCVVEVDASVPKGDIKAQPTSQIQA